ncbi:MAG: BON domain-containing protein [Bacteroidales bacterium]|nr:BON domain-containing protein [Bacteroidales bacterium]MCF8388792.1 BON domain-containing protein [Bacteroidales bacterium]MCF8399232.1 BON domain-containing protein [Bacteroidales bacterium]
MIKAEEIRKDVVDQIKQDERINLSDIEVIVMGGDVELNGTVEDFEQIEGAEAAAYKAQGVVTVINNLKIRYKPNTIIREDKKE